MSPADRLAHAAASYIRPARTVLQSFPAGGPRGSWPAEEFAARQCEQGQPATVVQDINADVFLVVTAGAKS